MRTYTEDEVVERVRERVAASSYRREAAALGVSVTYLRGIIERTMRPGRKVTDALGLVREVRYRPSD